ncbi:hypothetical protein GPSY_2977 [Paraglaciecola psychrophila 170]|nr:hypothetical protein GPSY_2977 [Paraglaciecola psychrophila 170]
MLSKSLINKIYTAAVDGAQTRAGNFFNPQHHYYSVSVEQVPSENTCP